jgi:hypothetical protein
MCDCKMFISTTLLSHSHSPIFPLNIHSFFWCFLTRTLTSYRAVNGICTIIACPGFGTNVGSTCIQVLRWHLWALPPRIHHTSWVIYTLDIQYLILYILYDIIWHIIREYLLFARIPCSCIWCAGFDLIHAFCFLSNPPLARWIA